MGGPFLGKKLKTKPHIISSYKKKPLNHMKKMYCNVKLQVRFGDDRQTEESVARH